jgi:hypothetical protein
VPEEIKMEELEKTKIADARSGKEGNRRPMSGLVSKR